MNTSETKFVVVIPTKNRRVLLERALNSVLSQNYDNYRIVIVNDGSTDDTGVFLESINNPRISIVNHKKSLGVNASRNEAFRTMQAGEWAVILDDDDALLLKALELIARAIEDTPNHISVLFFNTLIQHPDEKFVGGYQFAPGEFMHDTTYQEIMMGRDLPMRGDARMVLKWTLFPQYLFSEEINGFEGEWIMWVTRDGVGLRFLPEKTIFIDLAHEGEHLSNVAAKCNPASFSKAHERIFQTHKQFFSTHPRVAIRYSVEGLKLSIRAFDPIASVRFVAYYLQALPGLFFKNKIISSE